METSVKPRPVAQDLNVPALAVVKTPSPDEATYIFFYELEAKISYYKRDKNGNYSRHKLEFSASSTSGTSGTKTRALGSNSPLAAVLFKAKASGGYTPKNELRLFYIASDSTINELRLPDLSNNNWNWEPHINNKKWKASTNSGLSALGFNELGADSLELYFMDKDNGDKMTRAWSTSAPENWTKAEIE